jgi:hypothetical protein
LWPTAGEDAELLGDALFDAEPHGPAEERPVAPGGSLHLRHGRQKLVGELPVMLEVARPAEK